MCVADIEGKEFRADASDVAAGINTGFLSASASSESISTT